MIEEIMLLTEKQRKQMLSRKNPIAGDYIWIGDNIGKLDYIDRQKKTCLVSLHDGRQVVISKESREIIRPISPDILNRKKREWLEKKLYPSTIEQRISFLNKTLSSIYDKDNYEVTVIDPRSFMVIIHYPEITISNEVGLSHTIYDLYFSATIVFRNEKVYVAGLSLARSTFQENEFNGYGFYMFSHIRDTNDPLHLLRRNFCFGKTELDNFIGYIRSNGVGLMELKKFFYSMNNYFSWESVEGVPYYYISRLGNDMWHMSYIEDINHYHSFLSQQADKVMSKMNDFLFTTNVNDFYEWTPDITHVNGYHSLLNFISENVDINDFPAELTCYLVDGRRVTSLKRRYTETLKRMEALGLSSNFTFKGKPPKLKIILLDQIEDPGKTIHYDAIEEIGRIIQRRFKTYLMINNENN